MANSVVKVTDIKDDELDNSLLLLVGEDGTVTPDQATVETFLKQRSGPTNIQIMKFNQSEKQGIDITVNNLTYIPDAINEEVVRTESTDLEEIARNLHNFRLDHDYTKLSSPRRPSTPQEDELAKALSILDGPDPGHRMPPFSMAEPPPLIMSSSYRPSKPQPKVKLLQSITIAPPNKTNRVTVVQQKAAVPVSTPSQVPLEVLKPMTEQKVMPVKIQSSANTISSKNDCNTSTGSVQLQETPAAVENPAVLDPPKTKAKIIKTEVKITPKQERPKPAKAKSKVVKEIIEEESDDYEDFGDEIDFDLEDDEDDSDFDIEEELKVKPTPRRTSRRTKSESKGSPRSPLKKKSSSSEVKEVKDIKEVKDTKEVKDMKKDDKVQEKPVEEKPPVGKPVEEVKPLDKKPPKKEKKVVKPILDDFALFSTPDIIRRVGGKEPQTPITPEASNPTKPAKIHPLESNRKSVDTVQSPVKSRTSLDGKNEKEKERHFHHSPDKSENKSKERRSSMGDVKPKRPSTDERAKSKDGKPDRRISETFNRKTDKPLSNSPENTDNLPTSEDMPSAEDIRSIIMNEDTKSFTMDTVLNNSSQSLDPNNINLDATGLDLDPTLLDNLNNDEISEDILYQVAQSLVSNPELQNAIDKGINEGVLDPMAVDQNVVPNHNLQVQASNEDNTHGGTQVVRADGRIVVIPPIERPTTRSRNKRNEDIKQPFKPVHKPLDEEHVSGNELDSSNDEEEESEDDPNKLWCICNQPHNNRFMICCDTCEEWYHGKCVNITKAMGQQMESEGREWICLFCKDPVLKRPQAAARRVRKASRNSRASTDSASSERGRNFELSSAVPCVVCQKQARKNSIYCSETCILAHAQGIERVIVFERATGKMIAGNKAPSAANLDQWLKEHPGYEVVRSGGKIVTAKAGNLTQSRLKLVKNPNNHGVSLAIQKKGVNVGVLAHAPKHTQPPPPVKTTLKATITGIKPPPSNSNNSKQQASKEPAKLKLIPPEPLKIVQNATPAKPKLVQSTLTKTPQSSEKKQKTPNKEKVAPPVKAAKPKKEEQPPAPPAPKPQENIRDNVQKTIFEQLISKLKGSEDLKLTEGEVKTISTDIETQLFKCFGDTGQKYRNKYRSLIFNIKDAKNHTLWRRICEKAINPYELVRLSPDDLASQELALWREREAKHSLDMIKKSELELLNCNRQYVLKTHKGEQVVEDDRVDKIDNTEVIKSLTEGAPLDSGEPKKDSFKDDEKKGGTKHKDRERKNSRDKDHHLHRSSSRDDRDRSRGRKRSKSRDHKHSEYKKHSRSKDRDRDRHRKSSHRPSRHKKDIVSSTDKLDKKSKEILEQLVDNKIVPPLDRLWKHVPQDDILPGKAMESDSDHEPSSTVTIPTPPRIPENDDYIGSQTPEIEKNLPISPDKEKDSSDFSGRSTPPPPRTKPTEIWRGIINMIDVAQISITAHEVSGDCSGLGRELSSNLDIVGRISPDTVWDYISKMKCSNSKSISLIRLKATNVEEKMPYLALYSYLSSRDRLGVVKSMNKAVKDFYIYPLAPQKPIPQVLLPVNGPGFEESRPSLLLGIIVRDKRKRPYLDPPVTPSPISQPKRTRVETPPPPLPVVPTPAAPPPPPRSYTPPPAKDPRLKLPLILPTVVPPPPADEGDEPYSPEDSDLDAPTTRLQPPPNMPDSSKAEPATPPPVYPSLPGLSSNLPSTTMEIQRQMEELNKKIEMQKSEITSMTQNIVSASSEIGTSALASIALPSNLQQILDSIKTIGDTTDGSPHQESTQTDLTIPLMIPKSFTRPLGGGGTNLMPPQQQHHQNKPLADLPSDTIPLNLPVKPKIKPASVNSPLLEDKGSSVLGSLTEEELIKKAAEMLGEEEDLSRSRKRGDRSTVSASSQKRPKMEDVSLPPVPGMEDQLL